MQREEVGGMQTQLSPAHPDFGKLGFTELEGRIRRRAYQLYEKRDMCYALDDWLEAKAEVFGCDQRRIVLCTIYSVFVRSSFASSLCFSESRLGVCALWTASFISRKSRS